MTEEDAKKALDQPLPENDADAGTVRDYLKILLETLLIEEEGFSGKRPFGNSGWIYDIGIPLHQAGFIASEQPTADEIIALVAAL